MLPYSPTPGKTEIAIDSGYIEVDPKGSRIAVMHSFDPDFGFNVTGVDSFDLEDDISDIESKITIDTDGVVLNSNTEFTKLETGTDFISGVLI